MVIFRENEFKTNFTIPLNKFLKFFEYSFYFTDTYNFLEDKFKSDEVILSHENPMIDMELGVFNYSSRTFEAFTFDKTIKIKHVGEDNYYFSTSYELKEEDRVISYFGIFSEETSPDSNVTNFYNRQIKDVSITIDQNSTLSFNMMFIGPFKDLFSKFILNITKFDLYYSMADNIMNVDNEKFFNNYDFEKNIYIPSFLVNNFPYQSGLYNYGLIKLIDDNGIILSEKNESFDFKKLFDTPSLSLAFQDNINILTLRFDKITKTYERKYKKIQNVFAELGGLMNSFILIGSIIIHGFNKNKFFYELINHIFGSEMSNENKIFPLNGRLEDIKIKRNKSQMKHYNNNLNYDTFSTRIKPNYSRILPKCDDNIHSKTIFEKNFDNKEYVNDIKFKNLNKFQDISFSNLSKRSIKNIQDDMKSSTELSVNNENNYFENEMIKSKIVQFLKINKQKKKRIINFTHFEFMKTFLCCKNFKNEELLQKENIFNKLGDKLNDYMNIVNYCLLFENFEKLKMILLNKDQNFTFDYLSNRKIEHISYDNFEKKLMAVYKYFHSKEEKLDDIDTRLLKNLSPNFISFLN